MLKYPPVEETEPEEPDSRRSLLEEQLRLTQEKVCIKESEVDSGISIVMLKSELYEPDTYVSRNTMQSKQFSNTYFKED